MSEHTKDCPHRAAIDTGPWQSFDSYAAAKAWVTRKKRDHSGTAWIRCSIHQPYPNELADAGVETVTEYLAKQGAS